MARCRSCGADIIWVKMKSGKAMACDPFKLEILPSEEGKVLGVTEDGRTVRGDRFVILRGTAERDAAETVRISHFATCPNAASHRKAKR